MNMYDEGAKEEIVGIGTSGLTRFTQKDRLQKEKDKLSSRILEINEALEILDRNPDIERLLTILR